ncbi:hypothetical protein QA612_19345 [Evansella sp. AB-P1]|uniref:ABC-three component system middle component 1 n=1 Tax=Evansella sp. AB-P1 TaxID=3037653 RepID=UPI00241C1E2D|nr:ABC-three component system middle component 1 [Evansella sp. AB-P1]MDG5789617.1 hypothetical protein [Evansella sp. AB-P1]
MIELIKRVFTESNFEILEDFKVISQNYSHFFAKKVDGGRFDFYSVLQVREEDIEQEELNNIIKNLLSQILQSLHYPGIDKNMSLVILVGRKQIDISETFNKFIYEFEENPYDCKKYILPYTDEQLQLLLEHLSLRFNSLDVTSKGNDTYLIQLNEIISEKEWFSLFKEKENINENDSVKLYDLVSKIYIKLSFLKFKINKKELPNIAKDIREDIKIEDKGIVDKFLQMDNPDPKWDDILSVLGVELNEI